MSKQRRARPAPKAGAPAGSGARRPSLDRPRPDSTASVAPGTASAAPGPDVSTPAAAVASVDGLRAVRAAAGMVGVEAVALVAFAAWLLYESVSVGGGNESVAQGSAAYFVVIGLLVGGVAYALGRAHGWASGAALFCQLIALPMAWYMAQEHLWVGAVPLAALAVCTLVLLLRPSTRVALGR